MQPKQPDPGDLLWGAQAIADAIGRTRAATFHMLAKGYLPGRKVGSVWVSSRRRVLAAVMGEDDPGVQDQLDREKAAPW